MINIGTFGRQRFGWPAIFRVHRCTETPPGLANCWECVFPSLTKPSRGRENSSTKLIPLPPPGTGRSSPLPENPKSHKFGKLLDPLPRFPSWKRSEEGWRIFLRPRYARPRCSPARRLAGGGEGGWDYPAELIFILENSAPPRERKSFLNRTPSTFIPRLLVNSSKNSITIFRHEYFPRPGQISSHGWKLDEWTETIFFDTISYFCWIKLSYLVTFRENEVIIYTHIPFFNILNHDFSWQSFQLLSSKEGKKKKRRKN